MLRERLLDTNFSNTVAVILGIVAIVLLLFGIYLIIIFWKKRLHSSTQVIISSIPDSDLEKSPAPILPYKACSRGLLDYFTAIQKFGEATFDTSLNTDVWTDDVPETPPPCYEEALEMTLASAEMEENVTAH